MYRAPRLGGAICDIERNHATPNTDLSNPKCSIERGLKTIAFELGATTPILICIALNTHYARVCIVVLATLFTKIDLPGLIDF